MPIEQKDIDKAREILGETVKNLNDDEIKDMLVEMRYLLETWLDEYERKIFGGKTINELLGGI